MNVVLNRAVVVAAVTDVSTTCAVASHLQSQSELYHVSCWYYTLVIDLIGPSVKLMSRRENKELAKTNLKYMDRTMQELFSLRDISLTLGLLTQKTHGMA